MHSNILTFSKNGEGTDTSLCSNRPNRPSPNSSLILKEELQDFSQTLDPAHKHLDESELYSKPFEQTLDDDRRADIYFEEVEVLGDPRKSLNVKNVKAKGASGFSKVSPRP